MGKAVRARAKVVAARPRRRGFFMADGILIWDDRSSLMSAAVVVASL
jgi:hypothetical protein